MVSEMVGTPETMSGKGLSAHFGSSLKLVVDLLRNASRDQRRPQASPPDLVYSHEVSESIHEPTRGAGSKRVESVEDV